MLLLSQQLWKILSCMQEDELFESDTVNTAVADSKSNEILRFELLRNELIELEKRVQKSANQSENEEVPLTLLSRTAYISLSFV